MVAENSPTGTHVSLVHLSACHLLRLAVMLLFSTKIFLLLVSWQTNSPVLSSLHQWECGLCSGLFLGGGDRNKSATDQNQSM